MSNIKFNKMSKSLSISDGKRLVGFVDLVLVKEFMNSNRVTESFSQIDGNCKPIIISKTPANRIEIEKGRIHYGCIDTKEFLDYLNNHILDIKEFQKIK